MVYSKTQPIDNMINKDKHSEVQLIAIMLVSRASESLVIVPMMMSNLLIFSFFFFFFLVNLNFGSYFGL